MKQLATILWVLFLAATASAQTARVQVIHNAPSTTVDVYVNGVLSINDFAFRTARPFLDLPANLPLSLAVAPGNSASVADAFATFPVTFESGGKYAVTASGIVGNLTTPFTLVTDANALEGAAVATKVSLNVVQGAPDAPAVDVVVRTGKKIVANLAYGQFTPYLTLDPGIYYLDVKNAGTNTIIGTYKADLGSLAGAAIRVMVSGFLNSTPKIGLYAVFSDGNVQEFPNTPVARIQLLHNAPDQPVDVWANGDRILNDFQFLTATQFMYMPADALINLGVADEFSEAAQDTFKNTKITLTNGKTYLVTASGLFGDPNNPFQLNIFEKAQEAAADTNKVDIAFMHGALEVSDPLDFKETYLNTTHGNDLTIGQTSDYATFAPGVGDFGIFLQPSGIFLKEGRATQLTKSTAGVVFAATDPGATPSLGLYLLQADGQVKLLGEPKRTNLQLVHNAPSPRVDIYYGGNLLFDNADFRHYNDFFTYSDRAATVSIAPDTSTSVKSATITSPVTLIQGKNFAVYADGVVGDASYPPTATAREIRFGPLNGQVELTLHHGAPGVPAIDIAVAGTGNIFTNLAYGQNSGFVLMDPGTYTLEVKEAGTNDVIGRFEADLTNWGGLSLNVFTSGFTDETPVFGLFFSVLDGNTPLDGLPAYEFPRIQTFTKAQIIHNSASATIDVYANGIKLLDDFKYRTATPFVDVPAGLPVAIAIAPGASTSVADAIATFPVVFDESKKYIITASGIIGNATTPLALLINDAARETATGSGKVEIAVLHGATDAPPIDVDAVFVTNDLVTNLAYGIYTDYLPLDPDKYDLAVRPAGDPGVVASFRADLSGLADDAAIVFASGTLAGSPAFGLFAALTDGTVIELPLTPTARLQLIHNSPNPDSIVDVYAGNTRLLDDFKFRTATPFLDVPADRNLHLGIAAGNSATVTDTIASFPVNFEIGLTYVVFANGIIGNAVTPFTLLVDEALEVAIDPTQVAFATLHGAPGAPALELAVPNGPTLIPNLAYGEFTSYIAVDPANYLFRVKAAGTPTVIGTYIADLSSLEGAAARVFASGILGGTPGFGLFAALTDGTVIEFPLLPPPPSARVQLIHNAASPTVDIYANGEKIVDDFQYRTATSFFDILAETALTLAVAPANSTSAADAIESFLVLFEKDKTYIVTTSGIAGDTTTPFTLIVNEMGLEISQTAGTVSALVLHGATDAPPVDIDALFVTDNLVTNLAYGEFTPTYLTLDPVLYDLAIRETGSTTPLATYRVDLTGFEDAAITIFASGTLAGNPAFGLFAALADGTVLEFGLTPMARVQLIHNSPTPDLAAMDLYTGNTRLLDSFAYRTATPFLDIPADRSILFAMAPANSTSVDDAIAGFPVTYETGRTYAVFANGIVGDATAPFTLLADDARETAVDSMKVELATLNGAPNAPAMDLSVFGGSLLISNLAYGQFSSYLALTPTNYIWQLKSAGSPTVLANFQADLTAWSDTVARVFTSGIWGTPAFGLFAALPDGTVVEFPQIAAPPVARLQVIHNSPSPTIDVYANGNLLIDNFAYRTATPFFEVPATVTLTIAIAPENSQSANDAVATFPVTFEDGKKHVVTASGIVGDVVTPFTLIINNDGRESAAGGTVDVSVLHGSTNAPSLDLYDVLGAPFNVANLAYGAFTPYLNVDAGIYDLAVRATGAPAPAVIYRADLTSLGGRAATVFASGLVGDAPGFGLFAALPDGTVIEFPVMPTARVQIVHNSPDPILDVYAGAVPLIENFAFRTATAYLDLPADRTFRLGVAPDTSGSVADTLVGFEVNFASGKTYSVFVNGILGSLTTPLTLALNDAALESGAPGFVQVSVFHGSPGAPNVDIEERQAGPLFQNVGYGEYTPYLNIPTGQYFLDVKVAGDPNIAATYFADLSGLNGQAIRVFASGIVGGTPAFGLFAVLASGVVVELPLNPVARVQFLHNSPSAALNEIDVYGFTQLILDNFEFRTGTPFFYLPAGFPIPMGVALSNSQSSNDTIAAFPTTFENGKTYTVAVSGLLGGSPALSLIVQDSARERTQDVSKVELAFLQGIPDAPSLDILDYFTDTPELTDLQYGTFTHYLAFDPDLVFLRGVPTATPNITTGIWGGDFSQGAGISGVLFMTGQLGDDSHDLWLLLPDGTTLPLFAASESQAIHNAIGADVVDLYFDEDLVLDDFQYHTATGYGLFPARTPFKLSVAPFNSQSVSDTIFSKDVTLRLGKTYTIMAAGIAGGNPGFDLFINENARLGAYNANNAEPNFFHGAPDAPEIDVTTLGGAPVLFDNIQFGEYADYLSVPPANYSISVTAANNNAQVVQSYKADLSALGGEAFTVFSSGLLGGTPGFGLWVTLADGTTYPLEILVGTQNADDKIADLRVSPNPTVDALNLRFRLTESESLRYAIHDVAGRLMQEGDLGTLGAGDYAQRLDVSALPGGMYQLELLSGTGRKVVKVVVAER